MWQFTCDVENDQYETEKLPEHAYSNTTGKRDVCANQIMLSHDL